MPDDTAPAPALHPFLRDRWSTRLFDANHRLDDGALAQLLEAARWSPSAGNSQPWAFLVTRRGDAAHRRFVATLSRGNTSWVPAASAVLVSAYRAGDDEDPSLTYSDYAAYDLGQSVAHLTVQAQSMGLHVHQFAGFDHDAVTEAFAVPPAWKVTTGIAIGRRLDDISGADPSLREREERPRVRKEFAEFVFGERFGEPVVLD
ncbi:nitroreductase family protein [Nocardioides marmoriginsengisoli]|uniref:nitroreductase family protein n=1 Tax=Nocardioides marmoriginsengisoli TaxID=661483 RepID=UPI001FE97208|nr:nitroreductase family protein [Nocardioides marmoriginsengisoli]